MTLSTGTVSTATARVVFRILGEMRELRNDPAHCAEHLLAELSSHTRADAAGCNRRIANCCSGSVKGSGHVFGSTQARALIAKQFLDHPMFLSPVSAAAMGTRGAQQIVRGHRVSASEMSSERRDLYEDYAVTMDIGDSLMGKSDRCALPGFVGTLWVRRSRTRPRFSDDDAAMVGLLNSALEDWFWPSYTGWLGGPEMGRNVILPGTGANWLADGRLSQDPRS